MEKTEFVRDILDVLKKHGYKAEGVKKLEMWFDVKEIPEIEIEYFVI